ncbi:zonular occludens toxin domain-containing protein [Neisseria gonorrhoeae]|nr:zonular occludens toxin domain-containing protein [Neisseria gonorrhoeae]
MTRHPSQLDIFVRNLVSKHVHLERKAIGMNSIIGINA